MVITPEGAKYRKANQVIAKKIEKIYPEIALP